MKVKNKLAHKKNQKGDTLIEIAFALVIIGFIVAVAINGAIKAHQAAVTARKRTQATFIAQSQLELMQSLRDYYVTAFVSPDGTSVSNGDWAGLLNELHSRVGMSVDTSVTCAIGSNPAGTPSLDFFAFPAPSYTFANPQTAFIHDGTIDSPNMDWWNNLITPQWTDYNGNSHSPKLLNGGDGGVAMLANDYNNNFSGFKVADKAWLTSCKASPAGYGDSDVTIESTVTWTDSNSHTQTVKQLNRLTNN